MPKNGNEKRTDRCTVLLEALEPRVLLSADPFSLVAGEGADSIEEQKANVFKASGVLPVEHTPPLPTEIVLVNSDVPDVDTLRTAIQREATHRNVVLYTLDASKDGIDQTRSLLSQHAHITSVHLFSHGSAGSFALGSTNIDVNTLSDRADELEALGDLFSADGDLLIYGCNTGEGDDAFLNLLADQLNIDIAASDDVTGNKAAGGDWDLEIATGRVEHTALFTGDAAQDWEGLLAVINVTTTADVFDIDTSINNVAELKADPGPDGLISLREAIFAANLEASADEILLQSGTYGLTIAGGGNEAGDLDISESVTIRGQGATVTKIDVSANGDERGFEVKSGTVVLEDFTLTGASTNGGDKGAAIVADSTDLSLTRLAIDNNNTDTGVGGALHLKSNSTVTITDSTFSGNTAGLGEGPNLNHGGAIYNEGDLTIIRSTFSNNEGRDGGAIFSTGTLKIEDSSFESNIGKRDGGAIYQSSGGSLELDRVTLEKNQSTLDGGAIWVNGDAQLNYVTFSENISNDEAGALFTTGNNNRVENSTFYGNSSTDVGAAIKNTGTLEIKGSAFGNNVAGISDVVAGTVTSLGFNSWQPGVFSAAVDSDLLGLDPLLGPLQNNGGYVKTHLPTAGSPLIDAGFGSAGLDASKTTSNIIPDIGAVESRGTSTLEKIYWVDTAERAIYRSNTDGSEQQFIASTSLVPFDIEVDSANGYLYWIESDSDYESPSRLGSLFRSDMDGSNKLELKNSIDFPSGLALDLANGYIYVTSDTNQDNSSAPYVNRILRYNIDGSNETTIVSGEVSDPINNRMYAPTDIEYDATNQILYWSDRSTDSSPINAEVKMLNIGASGSPVQLFEPNRAAGERAYGLAVANGTTEVVVATHANATFYDYASGSTTSVNTIGGATRGVAILEEDGGSVVTDQSGTITHISSAGTQTEIINGLSEPGAIAVASLTPVNNAPVLSQNEPLNITEGDTQAISALLLDASDVDTGDSDLTFNVTTAPVQGVLQDSIGNSITQFSVSDIDAGEVLYAHSGGENTSDQFSFTLSDGVNTSATSIFNIAVTTVDDAPIANNDSDTLNEGSVKNISILSNDTDEETSIDTGSVSITAMPGNGAIVVNGDGTISYTHNGSETSTDSFQYTVMDQTGNLSNTATVTLNITPVNDAPIAADDSLSVNEGASNVVVVLTNDTDEDDGLDNSTVTINSLPSNGAVAVNPDGTITYTHNGSETTGDTFSYRVSDLAGDTSNVGLVSITINAVNDTPVAADDSLTINEGASDVISVLTNDTDADDGLDSGTVTITAGPSNGTATVNPDGTITYTHNGSETTADSFSYEVNDLTGDTSNIAVVTITVNSVNDSPVAADDALTLNEGATDVVPVLTNDTDTDDGLDSSTVTLTAGPTNGTATVNPDGTITYTHNGSETTADSFSYEVNDLTGDTSNTAVVTITVNSVNDSPVAADDALTLNEGATDVVPVLTNDTDNDDGLDNSTVTITSGPSHGSATVNPDGTVSYTHNGSETTADSFSYRVDDLAGDSSNIATVSITVNSVNDSPVTADDSLSVNEGATGVVPVLTNDTDTDDGLDSSTVTITTGPSNGTATVNPDGTITYTHNGSETTADSFSYEVNDLTGETSNTAVVTITVNSVNDSPVAADDSLTLNEGATDVVPVLTNDTDNDDGLDNSTVTITSGPLHGSATVNPDGTVSYAHNGSETTSDTFSYRVNDLTGAASSVATVNITINPVNDSPVTADDSLTINEGATGVVPVLTNDTDADDGLDSSTVTITTGPTNGTATVNPDGTITYTHNGSETIADSFSYRVNDLTGDSSSVATVSVTVNSVNDSPIAIDDSLAVNENATSVVVVLTNDTDADDGLDSGTVTITAAPSNGTAIANPDGTVSYTHNGSETTADSFSYRVSDLAGDTSNNAVVTITVNSVNDHPVATNDSLTLNEGASDVVPVLSNDTDPDDGLDSSTLTIVSVPSNGAAIVNADGTVSYTHDGSETTADTFSYRVSDFTGDTSNIATVIITVNPVNDPPVAANDSLALNEGASEVIAVLTNDTDADDGLDSSTVAITSGPTNGTAVVNPDGTITYTHNGSEATTDTFSYRVNDGAGQASNVATINITVNPLNDAPVATNDSLVVNEGESDVVAVLANDTDADDGLDNNSITITTNPINGTATINPDGTVTYSHNGSETTADSFSYRVNDLAGEPSNGVTVNITVNPVNDPPVAINDFHVINEGESAVVAVLPNDTDSDDALNSSTVTIVSNPTNGSVIVNTNGTITYTHDGTETSFDSFSYRVTDGRGAVSEPAIVSINVQPVNDKPNTTPDSFSIEEGNTRSLDVVGNDTDSDTVITDHSLEIIEPPEHGTLTVTGDGVLQYTHDGSETTIDSFTYRLVTGEGEFSPPAEVSLIISPVNDRPSLTVAPTLTVVAPAKITLPDNFAIDSENEELSYSAALPDGSELPDSVEFDPQTLTLSVVNTTSDKLPEAVVITASDADGAEAALLVQLQSDTGGQILPEPELVPKNIPVATEDTSSESVAVLEEQQAANESGETTPQLNTTEEIEPEQSTEESIFLISEEITELPASFRSISELAVEPGNAITKDTDTSELPVVNLLADIPVVLSDLIDLDRSNNSTAQIAQLLDAQRQVMDREALSLEYVIGTTTASTTVLSVGYLFWLTRSGLLLSGALSMLPAWRFVDPFPVLSHFEEDDENNESESLETMVDTKEDDVPPEKNAQPESKGQPKHSA